MKYEIQKVENIIQDSENITTNIHFFWQVHLVKPTSLRKEILKDSSDGNDEYGCNGFPLKEILQRKSRPIPPNDCHHCLILDISCVPATIFISVSRSRTSIKTLPDNDKAEKVTKKERWLFTHSLGAKHVKVISKK